MPISQSLLNEFDLEIPNTRKSLERVPDDKFGWKPHEKSPTMGWLAAHLAMILYWATTTMEQDSFNLAPPGGGEFQFTPPQTTKEVLEMFDKNAAAARAAIAGAADDQFLKPWTLAAGRENHLHHASHRRAPRLRDEPQHSPPCPARRLPAPEQYSGARHLRPLGG